MSQSSKNHVYLFQSLLPLYYGLDTVQQSGE